MQALEEQAMARARAMEAQARRCGACQVEGPPLEPDPDYTARSLQQAAVGQQQVGPSPSEPAPVGNTWASLVGSRGGNSWGGAPVISQGDPWNQG